VLLRPDWPNGVPALLVHTCRECGRRWYLPKALCGNCGCSDFDEAPADGSGTVAAVTTGFADDSSWPGLALVDLAEGVRVMVRCSRELRPGGDVELGFEVLDREPGPPVLMPVAREVNR
jgi:uncharacterized OB-fold protein